MAEALIKELGFSGILILSALPIVLLSVLIFVRGFEYKNFKLHGLFEKSTPTIDHYIHELRIDDDNIIGFEIPKPAVRIYGKLWNKEHINIYRLLEDKWRDGTKVDIIECNITSTLISLLEDKYQTFGTLTIYATAEQLSLLNYLKQYKEIQIESR